MGNCLFSSSRVENQNSSNTSDPSKGNSKSGFSSQPSSQTASSLPSTFTLSTSESFLSTSRSESTILSSSNLKAFTLSELKNSTRNFRPDSLLGEGGFGCVFKGWIDEETLTPSKPGSGMVVAVKRLKPEGFQGHKEWLTEVRYLGQLHHPNLVKLLGYCSEGESNRLLVYEFMSRGSLENHLFRRCGQLLPWPTRIKIAIAAARGLSFLHESENQVIYRDVKASNILLDSDFNAKLSDFGLAKAGPTGNQTHVSTQVVGTHGYAAPEYVQTGRLTVKADVYSFGVVLLELLTGKRALDRTRISIEQDLVAWARPYLGDKRKFFRIMDTSLEGQYSKKSAFTVANLSRQCTIQEPKSRPKMLQVLETLEQLQDSKVVRSRASHLKQSAAAAAATMKPTSRNPRRSPMPPSYSLPSH